MAKDIRFWFSMFILGLVVLFTLQNIATVEVKFLIWSLMLPRAIVLFLTFAAGAAIGWILGRTRKTGRRSPAK